MKSQILKTIKYLVFLTVGIAFFYLAFQNVPLESMEKHLREANYFWVLLSAFLGLMAMVSRGVRWTILLRSMGHPVKHSNSIYAVIIGYFANLAIPRIGEVTRCTSLNQVEGVPLNKLFGTVILERIIDFFLLIAIFIVATIIFAQEFIDFVSGLLSEKLKNGSFLSLIGGGLLSLVLIFILMFVYRNKLKGTKFFGKVIGFLSGIKEGIKSASKIKNKTNFIFHTAFIWLMYFLMIYVCFFSIPETSNLTAYDCIFVMVASGLGMVAPVQGGIGVYHMLVASALVVLGIKPLIDLATNQVISDPGLVFATIIHSCQTIMIVLFGAISFILLTINKKKFDRIEATIS